MISGAILMDLLTAISIAICILLMLIVITICFGLSATDNSRLIGSILSIVLLPYASLIFTPYPSEYEAINIAKKLAEKASLIIVIGICILLIVRLIAHIFYRDEKKYFNSEEFQKSLYNAMCSIARHYKSAKLSKPWPYVRNLIIEEVNCKYKNLFTFKEKQYKLAYIEPKDCLFSLAGGYSILLDNSKVFMDCRNFDFEDYKIQKMYNQKSTNRGYNKKPFWLHNISG